ncbi:uncharacterized protein LOC18437806 [Amborella trichopoda]|uniref:Uncharacterized protein n=1 Tax=Amborella trichopoda TaxID=13333 RepID=W1PPC7_AMBTC|nr:uncharacterized protein LOC18437806 [Amborella trichopoda]XP_020525235.1 uncharacterized protein LOC18437806 [Amborella trichopoda]ERN09649.1 hypothetical protein AMTR_s00029p00200280 [Amborella trichopoda]|eukprot:XP_020525234.1 uncharacterized protein LOC18437806 [Amborella trichopoda]
MALDTDPNPSPEVLEQKKRCLEALERRFLAAKAEALQLQNSKKSFNGEESKRKATDSPASATRVLMPSMKASPSSSSKQDMEANDPAYNVLSQPVHESLLRSDFELPTGRQSNIVDGLVHNLLQSGDKAQKYMQGSMSMKIRENYILLDNYILQGSKASPSNRAKARQRFSKCSKRHMSMRQHRKHGSLDLPKKFHKFALYKSMHEMWKDYVVQLLQEQRKGQIAQCLLTADLHGAILSVVQCRVAGFTGTQGIMIRETAETFGIVTYDNHFRVVPKKGSVFIFQAELWKITIYGDELSSRNIG